MEVDEDSTWHVICTTMSDWNDFLSRMKKSKDLDEKALYRHINDNVLPTLLEEEKEREKQRQLKELEYLRQQAYAARKRSTRLVQKEEDKKITAEREAERAKIRGQEEERKKQEMRIRKLEQEREARLLDREQRQKERELRIQQREEEKLKATEKESTKEENVSKKPTRAQLLESQRTTVEPQPEESWFFDCLCGQHGTNFVPPHSTPLTGF